MNSNYIAFEGIDGSGKTSIIENLSDILNSQNKEHIIVREPGGTSVGEGIRELLLSHDYQVNPLAEALLMSASRAQLIQETVKPSLDNGQIVITDRSAYSSVAYQGVGRELGYKKIYELNDLAIKSIWPKKVVLLDIDPKASFFLIGTEMDYEENELESGFKFKNPNEKGRCGCGESFHI